MNPKGGIGLFAFLGVMMELDVMGYPKPQIGYYCAECCLLDLYKIETREDLDRALSRVEDNDECGQLMVFATLDEAVDCLRDNGLTN